MLILWNFELASFNSFSRYCFPLLVAHFSVVSFSGCGCLRWVVCALSTEGRLAPEVDDDDAFDGCVHWFVFALLTEGRLAPEDDDAFDGCFVFALSTEGRLAPEDDDCVGPLPPLPLHRRLVGVEEEWLGALLISDATEEVERGRSEDDGGSKSEGRRGRCVVRGRMEEG